ncbi:major facilitator superfamily domain-containing protein [Dactylonectria macrodidyma]|uniref:Major facilitator superfamily domain-containing protein n=1 Tax=Dactylonectria macrodidyma TaxID=307937 RepID=A0A9P9ETA9_9HYPO|nr:major facilitator superfamily domain-containing protein [Dactylonectria macrodidyma]
MAASLPYPNNPQAEKIAASDTQPQPTEDKETQQAIVPEVATDDGNSTNGLERWNSPRINSYRFMAANLSLLIMGMNDACIGALIPYIETYYGLNYTTVSTVFVVPFAGYILAALTNNWLHFTVGQRGVAFLGPVCRLIGYIPIALHPPFPVLPCALLFSAFGNGIEDSAYNAWVGNMHNANELLGFLHGSYGLGGTISPLIASAMVTKANLEWYTFFYVMIGIVVIEFLFGMTAFWNATGAAYRQRLKFDEGKARTTTRMAMRQPITWLVALFLLGYVGAEVSLGGWVVTFMLRVRHAEPFLAGLTVTLFWLGLTIGRVVLGFITGRIGEKLAILVYLVLAIGLELLYWLVPNFAASVVFVMLLGFFLGPLFPAAVVVATKLLPADYHVSAIGFAAAIGGGGAALLPFAVGAIAQHKGVEVLQPVVLATIVFIIVIWLLLPGGFAKGGLERAREEKAKPGGDAKKAWGWIKAKAWRRD